MCSPGRRLASAGFLQGRPEVGLDDCINMDMNVLLPTACCCRLGYPGQEQLMISLGTGLGTLRVFEPLLFNLCQLLGDLAPQTE